MGVIAGGFSLSTPTTPPQARALRDLLTLGQARRFADRRRPYRVAMTDEHDTRVRVDLLPNPGEVLFCANRFSQRPDEASVPAFQLTWGTDGAFPGEPGSSKPGWLQPKPGGFRA